MHTLSSNSSLLRHKEISVRPLGFKALEQIFNPTPNNSLRNLLVKMGPFIAETDAYHFKNSFPLTEENIEEVWNRFVPPIDYLLNVSVKDLLDAINGKFPKDSLSEEVTSTVTSKAVAKVVEFFLNLTSDKPVPTFGRCGGMAFSAYDFYINQWLVDERFGTEPPASGTLSEYIFSRLLDSLDLNVVKFLEWILHLHVMPIVSKTASSVLYSAVGSAILPVIGTSIGAYIGIEEDIFKLGGPSKTLKMTKNEEWPKIKNKLDKEAACPIGLIFGDSVSPTSQHQILAIGYEDINDGTAILTVWDNNYGNIHLDYKIDFRGNELEVKDTISKHPIKGFFMEDYNFKKPSNDLKLV